MKKIIFRGPVQTASGYGVHARMLLKSLIDDGRFDITVMSVPWGATPLIYEKSAFMNKITELAMKFNPAGPHEYDASIQVTIPNEFANMATKNICVTAGIETDRVAAIWQQKTNEVADVLIVPSFHSARSFTTGIYNGMKGPQQILLRKPLYILPEWVDANIFNTTVDSDVMAAQDKMDFSDMPDFNFVVVGLGMDRAEGEDRKNITNTVKWFCEQFKDRQDVGLVMKVSMVNASPLDYRNVSGRIKMIKAQAGCDQFPKIKLIHGRLSDQELAALYKHPKVKAMISLTHGEGYGLPLIEAAACALPIIATNWSGHLDFLRVNGKNKFVPVDYDLQPIPAGAVWKDVLEEGTLWANPREADAKMKMAKVVASYDKPKEWATELSVHISKTFNENLGKEWADDMFKLIDEQPVKLTKHPLIKTAPLDKILPVTMVAVSDGKYRKAETEKALSNSRAQINFVEEKHLIAPMNSVDAYDTFVAKELHKHIDTSHALVIQWDGYVLNGSAWDDKFLEYDYVGAPWYFDNRGMNSGFMLISKKMLEELSKDEYTDLAPFDLNLFKNHRSNLEAKGFKFAPPEVSSKFSVENLPYSGQFGWHGENPFNGEI